MKSGTIISITIILIFQQIVESQISSGGIPLSFTNKLQTDYIRQFTIPSPNLHILSDEDKNNDSLNLPHRFMEIIPVDIDFMTEGTWEHSSNNTGVCRLILKSHGAWANSLYFDTFYLPEGTGFYLYDETDLQLKGAYTEANNPNNRLFATELLNGDAVILELNIPDTKKEAAQLHISGFGYAYREVPGYTREKGFGNSDFCEVNIGCAPEGTDWQDVKSGIVRIQVRVSGSAYWCTGSLLNNAKNDLKPYILTADHCAFQLGHYATANDLAQWLFYFNYESGTCEDPPQEPQVYSMVGATKIANGGERGNTGSDFFLVLLNQQVPNSYHPYFHGWSAINEISNSGVTIHHPEGDIKKISTYSQPVESSGWFGNGVQSHWKVFWLETANGWGVTEGGSSGSPLFNNAGRIIGTLTGGYSGCESTGVYGPDKPDYYGKFSYHWESNGTEDTTRLKPWLDPDNTGISIIDGLYVGINENYPRCSDEIFLFPNPVRDIVNINFINFEPSIEKVEIIDIMGRTIVIGIIKNQSEQLKLDISKLPAGVYMAGINYRQKRILKKFVKM